ncbi:uncharacterized protein LOC111491515 isoform X1 [Cucurbita maxima]|uniref:Uncharacterized protein LOC111491515 isoform X1 n=2 Tax=Cucurbita maxima TaxID=3661 RepID=A0A6J1K849_CUCMA|nr:uncharacterized protein LOC111491515 isoform X1 [Cucurbita maxima]
MGSRTNFYKNPSISYKKDLNLSSALQNLRAYNIAIGNAPPTDDQPSPVAKKNENRKRLRRETELSGNPKYDVGSSDGPMSHQDYIEKRRKEANRPQPYETLSEDVLGTSSFGLNLVGYESDESTSSESAVKPDHQNSSLLNEFEEVEGKTEQRFAIAGEPVCVVCGRYGEYICNETNDDICSMECKFKLLEILKRSEESSNCEVKDVALPETKYILPSPEFGEDTWDYKNHRWSKTKSNLCTYECWKCQKPGHLAEDCLVRTSNQVMQQKTFNTVPSDLIGLYKRCYQIGKNLSNSLCNECSCSFSLATCLDCSTVYCDSAGHLNEHIHRHPTHGLYYSHKLKRLVKCCKSTCRVTDIKDLLVCHYCFDKAFDKFYDMYTASWNGAGLSIISGSICCEDHFAWHRMNCFNADVEDAAYIVNRNTKSGKSASVSDFIF